MKKNNSVVTFLRLFVKLWQEVVYCRIWKVDESAVFFETGGQLEMEHKALVSTTKTNCKWENVALVCIGYTSYTCQINLKRERVWTGT